MEAGSRRRTLAGSGAGTGATTATGGAAVAVAAELLAAANSAHALRDRGILVSYVFHYLKNKIKCGNFTLKRKEKARISRVGTATNFSITKRTF